MRLYACFCDAVPDVLVPPVSGKSIIACPRCLVATHQHEKLEQAVREWNYEGSHMWRSRVGGFWKRIRRWWYGRNV